MVRSTVERARQRYGAGAEPPPTLSHPAIDVMLDHRSVRGYRADPLPEGALSTLMAAAQSAATSSNLQTWSVVTVDDQEDRAKCAAWAGGQKQIEECPLFLLFIADLSRLNRVAAGEGLPSAANDTFEMFLVAAIDASLAAQNMVTAAEALGLSTVYIGGMRNEPEKVARLIALPDAAAVVFGLCVGYAAEGAEGSVKPRLPQDAVLHRGRYRTEPEATAVPRYNEAMSRFNESQGMDGKGRWTRHSARRVSGPDSMSGRDDLMHALRRMGFFRAENGGESA